MPLGSLQKGSFDVSGAAVEIFAMGPTSPTSSAPDHLDLGARRSAPAWMLRIKTPTSLNVIELGVAEKEEAIEWATKIRWNTSLIGDRGVADMLTVSSSTLRRDVVQKCSDRENLHREIEVTWRIAKELSDMIVYCRAVTFNQERLLRDGRNPHEMSSFPETKAEKLLFQEYKFFIWYHQVNAFFFLFGERSLIQF